MSIMMSKIKYYLLHIGSYQPQPLVAMMNYIRPNRDRKDNSISCPAVLCTTII